MYTQDVARTLYTWLVPGDSVPIAKTLVEQHPNKQGSNKQEQKNTEEAQSCGATFLCFSKPKPASKKATCYRRVKLCLLLQWSLFDVGGGGCSFLARC